MSEQNTEKMTEIADHIINALKICLSNKDIWKNDKEQMIQLIKNDNPIFYEKYPRICRVLIKTDDITPLLGMLSTYGKVQSGEISSDTANNLIQGAINSMYVDPVINSEKLVKERNEKKVVEISNNF